MNITSQTAKQVKNDTSATEARDSALARYEEEAQEKRRLQNKKTVEIDVKQAMKTQTDNRIGNYSKTEVGSGTLIGDNPETESPDERLSSVAKRKSPRRQRLTSRRDMSSTHTLDVTDDNPAVHSGMDKIDPMLKLQTKEHSTGRRNQRLPCGIATTTPSIVDLNIPNTQA